MHVKLTLKEYASFRIATIGTATAENWYGCANSSEYFAIINASRVLSNIQGMIGGLVCGYYFSNPNPVGTKDWEEAANYWYRFADNYNS